MVSAYEPLISERFLHLRVPKKTEKGWLKSSLLCLRPKTTDHRPQFLKRKKRNLRVKRTEKSQHVVSSQFDKNASMFSKLNEIH